MLEASAMHKTTNSRLVVPPSIICISPLSFRAHSVAEVIPVSVDRLAAPADPDRWGLILPESHKSGGKARPLCDSRLREPKLTSGRRNALTEIWFF
jgi:hypothetical protein